MLDTKVMSELPVVALFLVLVVYVLRHTQQQAVRHENMMAKKDKEFTSTLLAINKEVTTLINEARLEIQELVEMVRGKPNG